MENYPTPPLSPPPPGGYDPFNPYAGYDPNYDYVPWLPGRQGPRFLPLVLVIAVVLVCSCCAFFSGVIFGIELPGLLAASPPPQEEPLPEEEPTPEGYVIRVLYPT